MKFSWKKLFPNVSFMQESNVWVWNFQKLISFDWKQCNAHQDAFCKYNVQLNKTVYENY